MTAEAQRYRDKTLIYALLISVAIHVVLLLPVMKDFLFRDLTFPEIEEPVVIPMEFELVSPPENPVPSSRLSKYLSTVSSRASDRTRRETESDLPHSEGRLPIPETPVERAGPAVGGKSELPPLPEEESDLGEALERSRFVEKISPSREPSLPEREIDFKSEGSVQASIGGISINTTAWDFAPYLLELKHRIKQHWIPPLAFTALGAIHGYTWVRFRVLPDGHMEAMEVLEEEGHESLTRSSLAAIRGAAPFRPLPDDFPEDHLEITFGFYYLLPGDEEKFFRKE